MKTRAPNQAGDWGDGDGSYAINFLAFGNWRMVGGSPLFEPVSNYDTAWNRKATVGSSFPDGTSNTIGVAEKYAWCDGVAGSGGCWWYRGVFHFGTQGSINPGSANPDSYPGDQFSCVFGGGNQYGGPGWTTGINSMFQVQPQSPTQPSPIGKCDVRKASTSHNAMVAALMDGSVRSVSPTISVKTWYWALTPEPVAGEQPLPADWN
jgi:hypothetical protein